MTTDVLLFQYEKILNFITTAKGEGATILHGGGRPQVRTYPDSQYIVIIMLAILFCDLKS